MALRNILKFTIIIIIFQEITSSIDCPYKCSKCQYLGNLDNKILICLECNENYKLSNDRTYCYSICDDNRYYLDFLEYIGLSSLNNPQLSQTKMTYDCVPTCDFSSYYTDEKTKSCITMNLCPYVNQYGFNIEGDLEAYNIKFSKKQNLLAAYFESTNYIRLWHLNNGEYVGEIQIVNKQLDSASPQNDKLTSFFFGDKLLLEESLKDKDILIGITNKKIYIWDTRIGSLIQSYESGETNIFSHYFYKEKQYIFLLNPQTLEIFLFQLHNQQTLFIGFTASSSFVQQVYNQYSNELACFSYSDKTNKLNLQVFFLDQNYLIGVFNKQIDLQKIEFINQLIVIAQNLYLILSNHIPYLVNSESELIQMIEIPLFSKIIDVQLPFQEAINIAKLDLIKLERDNKQNLNLAIVQQKSNSSQTSLTLNIFQDNSFQRVVEIIPEINIYTVKILDNNIQDESILRLFCINDLQTKIIIYEIDLNEKSIMNTYSIDQQFPIISTTLFLTGSWQKKELVFYNSQLLVFLQLKNTSQFALQLNIKFEIRNYNQVHLINYDQLKIHKITKMYEDNTNNYFIYLNQILKEIRVVDLKKHEIVGKIIFQESTNCLPIDFMIRQFQNPQLILILCDNEQIYIYDYTSFQLVSYYTFYNADENSLIDFAFLQNVVDNRFLIVFSSKTIIKLSISTDGKIINSIINENFNQTTIKDIIYFADNQNNPKILYLISLKEFSIFQINPETLELYTNRTQYKRNDQSIIFSYNIDYQKQQIGISCDTNEIIIFNSDLVQILGSKIKDNLKCYNPRQIDEVSIICNIQVINTNQQNKQNNFIGIVKNNSQIDLFGSYFEDQTYFFDDQSKQLLYYTNLDNVNMLAIRIYANQKIYSYSTTYILTQDIFEHYYRQGSDRMYFAQNKGFDVEALHFDQQFEYIIKQIDVNDQNTIKNVIILNERNQLIEVKNNGFIIYTLSTNEMIYDSHIEIEQCLDLQTNSLIHWNDDDFILFICDFYLYQLKLVNMKQYKIKKFQQEGVMSYLYLQNEQKMIIQLQNQNLYLQKFYIEEDTGEYTLEEYQQYSISVNQIISFMFEPNLQSMFCLAKIKSSYYIYRFMLQDETPLSINSLIGDAQVLDQPNIFVLNSETKFLIIIMNKIIYVINLDNERDFSYQQIIMQGVEQYQILSSVLILRNQKKILIFTINEIIQAFLNYQSNVISPQVTIKNNLIQTFLTIPDFKDSSKWLLIVTVKLNLQTQIYIYDQTGQIVQSIPIQTNNDFASQLQYDVKSKILYVCTQKGVIIGIESTFGFLQAYQINTKYSLSTQYDNQTVRTYLYFYAQSKFRFVTFYIITINFIILFQLNLLMNQLISQDLFKISQLILFKIFIKKANQFVLWNQFYIGVISITNFIEIPQNIIGRIKTSYYLSEQTKDIYLFDEANILWRLSFDSNTFKYVYSFGNVQEQANIIYIDSDQKMLIQQEGNIFVALEGKIAYKYQILAQKFYKNFLILVNNSEQKQLFQGLLLFTLDRKVFFLNNTFQIEEIYQFKYDQSQNQCILPSFIVASDFQSVIIIFDKQTLKIIQEIKLEEQNYLIELYCESVQNIFFVVDSEYNMSVFYITQESYNIIMNYQIPYPFPFVKGKLQIYFENNQNRVFFIQVNKRQIYCYDYKLKVSLNSFLIPPCPNFTFKITSNFIFLTCLYQFNLHFKQDMKYLMSIYTNESIQETIQSIIEISPQFILLNSNQQISIFKFTYGYDATIQVELIQNFQTNDEEILFYDLIKNNNQILLISQDTTQIYSRSFSTKVQKDHYRCYQDIALNNYYQLNYHIDNIQTSLSLIKPIPKFIYINCFFNYQFFFSQLGLQDFLLGIRVHQKEIGIQDELRLAQNGFDPTQIENFNFQSLKLFELQNIENLKHLSLINISLNLTRINNALQAPKLQSYTYVPNQFQKQNDLIFKKEYIVKFINQTLESIVLQNILIRNQTLSKTIYQIEGSQKVIIKNLVLNKINLKNSILFYIQNVENVIIENIVISECILDNSNLFFIENSVNLEIKNANIFLNEIGYSSSLLYIANTLQNIQITNFTLQDNKNQQAQNELLKTGKLKIPCLIIIQKVYQCLIQSLNFLNNNQVQLLFYSNQYQTQSQQIEIKNDQINVYNLTLFHNIFEIEDQSNLVDITSLIFLKSIRNTILFGDIQFNKSPYSKGIINIAENQLLQISDIYFYNNTSLEGGCLYISDTQEAIISYSNFTENKALASGGALYLKNSQVTLRALILFKSNKALIGGAVRLTSASNLKLNSDSDDIIQFLDNKAEITGNTVADFQKFKLKLKDNFFDYQQEQRGVDYEYGIQMEQVHVITLLRPGALLSFLLDLEDEEQNLFTLISSQISQYPQVIQEELQKITIQISTKNDEKFLDVNSNFMINLLSYSSIDQGFFLENIQFNMKQLLLQDQINYSQNISMNQQINFQIKISDLSEEKQESISEINFAVFFRACQKGEIISQNQLKHYQCLPCDFGSYSLQTPQIQFEPNQGEYQRDAKCLPCPQEALSCFRDQIYLKNGFWRYSINDDSIYQCKSNNCLAQDFNQTKICNEGYTGPLCESCEEYAKLGMYKCVECNNITELEFKIHLGIIFFLTFIFLVMQTYVLNKQFKYVQIGYYMRRMGILSISKSCEIQVNFELVKIMVYFIQIFSVVNQINKFPLKFIPFDVVIGKQPQSVMERLQCIYLNTFFKEKDQYDFKLNNFRILMLVLTPFVYQICLSIIYYLLLSLKIIKRIRNFLYSLFQIISLLMQPNIILNIFVSLSCRNIGNNLYILNDMKHKCFSNNHLDQIYFIILPSLIVWFGIPLYYLFQIIKQKKDLDQFKQLFKYGVFYQEFKKKCFYWEFVRLSFRILITISITIGQTIYFTINHFSMLLLILYLIWIYKRSPYREHRVWKLDIITNVVLILIIILNLEFIEIQQDYEDEKGKIINNIIQSLIFILYFGYLLYIVQIFLATWFELSLKDKILPLLFKLKNRFCILKYILKADTYQKKNQMATFKKWMFIKKSVQIICSMQSRKFLLTEENRPKSINFSKINVSITKQEDSPVQIDTAIKNIPQIYPGSKIQDKDSQQEVFLSSDFSQNLNSIFSPKKQCYKDQIDDQSNESKNNMMQRHFQPKIWLSNCPSNCLSCYDEDQLLDTQTFCSKCNEGYQLNQNNTLCVSNCEIGLFYDNKKGSCQTSCSSYDQLPNSQTKSCDQIIECPKMRKIGQQLLSNIKNVVISEKYNVIAIQFPELFQIQTWSLDQGNFKGKIDNLQIYYQNSTFYQIQNIIIPDNYPQQLSDSTLGIVIIQNVNSINVYEVSSGVIIRNIYYQSEQILFVQFEEDYQYIFITREQNYLNYLIIRNLLDQSDIFMYPLEIQKVVYASCSQIFNECIIINNNQQNQDDNSYQFSLIFINIITYEIQICKTEDILEFQKFLQASIPQKDNLAVLEPLYLIFNQSKQEVQLASKSRCFIPLNLFFIEYKFKILKDINNQEIYILALVQLDQTSRLPEVQIYQFNINTAQFDLITILQLESIIKKFDITTNFLNNDIVELIVTLFTGFNNIYYINIKRKAYTQFTIKSNLDFILDFVYKTQQNIYVYQGENQIALLQQQGLNGFQPFNIIQNYNQEYKGNKWYSQSKKITQLYEDSEDNYLLYYDFTNDLINIVDLENQQLKKQFQAQLFQSEDFSFKVIKSQGNKFLVTFNAHLKLLIYDYQTFSQVFSQELENLNQVLKEQEQLGQPINIKILQNYDVDGEVITYNINTVFKFCISSEGNISKFDKIKFENIVIFDLVFFSNQDNLIYLLRNDKFQIIAIEHQTMKQSSLQSQIFNEDNGITQYTVDYELKYITAASIDNIILTVDEKLLEQISLKVQSINYYCTNPTYIDQYNIFCLLQPIQTFNGDFVSCISIIDSVTQSYRCLIEILTPKYINYDRLSQIVSYLSFTDYQYALVFQRLSNGSLYDKLQKVFPKLEIDNLTVIKQKTCKKLHGYLINNFGDIYKFQVDLNNEITLSNLISKNDEQDLTQNIILCKQNTILSMYNLDNKNEVNVQKLNIQKIQQFKFSDKFLKLAILGTNFLYLFDLNKQFQMKKLNVENMNAKQIYLNSKHIILQSETSLYSFSFSDLQNDNEQSSIQPVQYFTSGRILAVQIFEDNISVSTDFLQNIRLFIFSLSTSNPLTVVMQEQKQTFSFVTDIVYDNNSGFLFTIDKVGKLCVINTKTNFNIVQNLYFDQILNSQEAIKTKYQIILDKKRNLIVVWSIYSIITLDLSILNNDATPVFETFQKEKFFWDQNTLSLYTVDKNNILYLMKQGSQLVYFIQFQNDQNQIELLLVNTQQNFVIARSETQLFKILDKQQDCSINLNSSYQKYVIVNNKDDIDIYLASLQNVLYYFEHQNCNLTQIYQFKHTISNLILNQSKKMVPRIYFDKMNKQMFICFNQLRYIEAFSFNTNSTEINFLKVLEMPGENSQIKMIYGYILIYTSYQINVYDRSDLTQYGIYKSYLNQINYIYQISFSMLLISSNEGNILAKIQNNQQNQKQEDGELNIYFSLTNERQRVIYYEFDEQLFLLKLIFATEQSIYDLEFTVNQSGYFDSCYQNIFPYDQYQYMQIIDDFNYSLNQKNFPKQSLAINIQINDRFKLKDNFFINNIFQNVIFRYKTINMIDENPIILSQQKKVYPFEIKYNIPLKELTLKDINFRFYLPKQQNELNSNSNIAIYGEQHRLHFENILIENEIICKGKISFSQAKELFINNLIVKNSSFLRSSLISIFDIEKIEIQNSFFINCTLIESTIIDISNIQSLLIKNITFKDNELFGSSSQFITLFNISLIEIQIFNVEQNVNKFNIYNNFNLQKSEQNDKIISLESYQNSYLIQLLLVKYIVNTNIIIITNLKFVYRCNNSKEKIISDVNGTTQYILNPIFNQYLNGSYSDSVVRGFSLIKMESSEIMIQNSTITGNVSPVINGVIQIVQSQKALISDSKFNYNQALEGGALYFSGQCQISIQNSYFIQNIALFSGGAILVENQSTLELINSVFLSNLSQFGGAIRTRLQSKLNYDQKTQTSFMNNQGQVWGNNWSESSLLKMKIKQINCLELNEVNFLSEPDKIINYENSMQETCFDDYKISQVSSSGVINNMRSGGSLNFVIQLIDQDGQYFNIPNSNQLISTSNKELNQMSISIQSHSSNLIIQNNLLLNLLSYSQEVKGFLFENVSFKILEFEDQTKEKNQNFTFSIALKSFYGNYAQMIEDFQFNIHFRLCKQGEIYQKEKSNDGGIICYQCQKGSYLFDDPMDILKNNQTTNLQCKECPQSAYFCFKNLVFLKNGYWRESPTSEAIIYCNNEPSNCLAQTNKNQTFVCKVGHIGPLCESCDNYGTIWNYQYVSNLGYKCTQCYSEDKLKLFAYVAILYIGFTIYMYMQVGNHQEQVLQIKIGYYIRMMGFASIYTSCLRDRTRYKIKLLTYFLQIANSINRIELYIPSIFNYFILSFGSPSTSLSLQSQCLLLKQPNSHDFTIPLVYSQRIIAFLSPFLYFLGISLIYYLLTMLKLINNKNNFLTTSFVLVCFFLQPDVIAIIVSALSCRKIGDKFYVQADVQHECFDQYHSKFVYFFFIPAIIFWLIVPLIFFKRLSCASEKNREGFSMLQKYGYLYSEYKTKLYFWEFLKIILRMFITISTNMFSQIFKMHIHHLNQFNKNKANKAGKIFLMKKMMNLRIQVKVVQKTCSDYDQISNPVTKSCDKILQCPSMRKIGQQIPSNIKKVIISEKYNVIAINYTELFYITIWSLDQGLYKGKIDSIEGETNKAQASITIYDIIIPDYYPEQLYNSTSGIVIIQNQNCFKVYKASTGQMIDKISFDKEQILFAQFEKDFQYVYLLQYDQQTFIIRNFVDQKIVFIQIIQVQYVMYANYNKQYNELIIVNSNQNQNDDQYQFSLIFLDLSSNEVQTCQTDFILEFKNLFNASIQKIKNSTIYEPLYLIFNQQNKEVQLVSKSRCFLPLELFYESYVFEILKDNSKKDRYILSLVQIDKNSGYQSEIEIYELNLNTFQFDLITVLKQDEDFQKFQITSNQLLDNTLECIITFTSRQHLMHKVNIESKTYSSTAFVSNLAYSLDFVYQTSFQLYIFCGEFTIALLEFNSSSGFQTKNIIQNFNQENEQNKQFTQSKKITQFYEDQEDNYILYYDLTNELVSIANLENKKLIIQIQTQVFDAEVYCFKVIKSQGNKYLVVINSNLKLHIYEYQTFSQVFWQEYEQSDPVDIKILQNYNIDGEMIAFNPNNIYKFYISPNGSVSKFSKINFENLIIYQLVFFSDSDQFIYLLREDQYQIIAIDQKNMLQSSLSSQIFNEKNGITQYSVDQELRYITTASVDNIILTFDENLDTKLQFTFQSVAYLCTNPNFVDLQNIFCLFQPLNSEILFCIGVISPLTQDHSCLAKVQNPKYIKFDRLTQVVSYLCFKDDQYALVFQRLSNSNLYDKFYKMFPNVEVDNILSLKQANNRLNGYLNDTSGEIYKFNINLNYETTLVYQNQQQIQNVILWESKGVLVENLIKNIEIYSLLTKKLVFSTLNITNFNCQNQIYDIQFMEDLIMFFVCDSTLYGVTAQDITQFQITQFEESFLDNKPSVSQYLSLHDNQIIIIFFTDNSIISYDYDITQEKNFVTLQPNLNYKKYQGNLQIVKYVSIRQLFIYASLIRQNQILLGLYGLNDENQIKSYSLNIQKILSFEFAEDLFYLAVLGRNFLYFLDLNQQYFIKILNVENKNAIKVYLTSNYLILQSETVLYSYSIQQLKTSDNQQSIKPYQYFTSGRILTVCIFEDNKLSVSTDIVASIMLYVFSLQVVYPLAVVSQDYKFYLSFVFDIVYDNQSGYLFTVDNLGMICVINTKTGEFIDCLEFLFNNDVGIRYTLQ
ncbi:hypothetical protein ABPG73_021697 [Tetrahymena malaccensis]